MEQYVRYIERKWGKRIDVLFHRMEQEAGGGGEAAYQESLLSVEVKAYFADLAAGEAAAEPETEKNSLLCRIYSVFHLDDFEKMCLELAILGELNPYFEKFFIYMNNDWNAGCPTFDTAVKLYTLSWETQPGFYRYFEAGGKLADYFLRICRQEEKSRVRWGFRCRDALFSFLLSQKAHAGEACGAAYWYEAGEDDLQEEAEENSIFSGLESALKNGDYAPVSVSGCSVRTGIDLIRQYAGQKKQTVCFLDIRRLAAVKENGESIRETCFDIFLQALLQGSWICMYCSEGEALEEGEVRLIFRLAACLKRWELPWLLLGGRALLEEKKDLFGEICPKLWEIEIEKGEGVSELAVWEKYGKRYPLEEDVTLDFFANGYGFTPAQVEQVFQRAERKRLVQGREKITRKDLQESCIRQTGGGGNQYITVVESNYSFADLVLPGRQLDQLQTACNRIRYKDIVYGKWDFGKKLIYGRGVSMIFSGPPGTGKTMSAGIVANMLGAALYRVNLAAVVSKYIGETEKNLHMVFETAENGRGVLFFDEADVLFGQRTQVKDSHDKHSNMEAAYLLQKMEEYEGVVILATNYMQNIDEAFKRRISFFIEFPLPDASCRRQIWEKAFPKRTEFEETPDYDFLAERFELSGSHIKSIALQAAFLAAAEGSGIAMRHILQALVLEMKKTGRQVTNEDLGAYGG